MYYIYNILQIAFRGEVLRIGFLLCLAIAMCSSSALAKAKSLSIKCHTDTKFTLKKFPEFTPTVEKYIDRDPSFKLDFTNQIAEHNNDKISFKENNPNIISFALASNAESGVYRLILGGVYYEINYKKMTMFARQRVLIYEADATKYSLPYPLDVNLDYKCKKI